MVNSEAIGKAIEVSKRQVMLSSKAIQLQLKPLWVNRNKGVTCDPHM